MRGAFDFKVSLPRRLDLKSGLGPTAEILSFAWPKESIQRKGHPIFRQFPALLAFAEGFRKGLPSPSENERHPCSSPEGRSRQKLRCSGRNNGNNPIAGLTGVRSFCLCWLWEGIVGCASLCSAHPTYFDFLGWIASAADGFGPVCRTERRIFWADQPVGAMHGCIALHAGGW
ncbi:hypothetical protein EDE11_102227 [Methylomonas methanica]|uniref:Uncharacterized protein n=1 Tax=Methylomonas methanica TaxID=421 RepID=A0ABY2CRW8_METMH|nr:hypothetical protein EDE11_102227 [Methylomonas methanica]